MNTPVTMHFTIEEMYASDTAKAKGINNKPNVQQMINLVYLCAYVLEPLRVAMGEPIKIGSGFRSAALNKVVGGAWNSQHTKGQAADLCIDGPVRQQRPRSLSPIHSPAPGLSARSTVLPSRLHSVDKYLLHR